MERLKPLNDFIFQKLFGEKGREPELLALLNAILSKTNNHKLVNVEIIENTKLVGEMVADKTGVLDIRALTDVGTHINIEVQRKNYGNMHLRSPFYTSMLLSKAIRKGEDYDGLTKVIAVNILDFEYIDLPNFHTSFHLREDSHPTYMLTDTMEIHYIEVPKFRKLASKDFENPLHRWLLFFDEKTPNDIIRELVSMDTAIKQTYDYLDTLSGDEETIHLYQAREMAIFDYKSGIFNAKRENSLEIAKKLLQRGSNLHDIAEDTGLNLEILEKLQKEAKN